VRAATHAAATTAKAFGRVLHQLWLEVTGVIFLLMALSFAGATVKEYGKYHAGQAGLGRVAVAICFTVTFAWFWSEFFLASEKEGVNSLSVNHLVINVGDTGHMTPVLEKIVKPLCPTPRLARDEPFGSASTGRLDCLRGADCARDQDRRI